MIGSASAVVQKSFIGDLADRMLNAKTNHAGMKIVMQRAIEIKDVTAEHLKAEHLNHQIYNERNVHSSRRSRTMISRS